jgi:hypothetical protein
LFSTIAPANTRVSAVKVFGSVPPMFQVPSSIFMTRCAPEMTPVVTRKRPSPTSMNSSVAPLPPVVMSHWNRTTAPLLPLSRRVLAMSTRLPETIYVPRNWIAPNSVPFGRSFTFVVCSALPGNETESPETGAVLPTQFCGVVHRLFGPAPDQARTAAKAGVEPVARQRSPMTIGSRRRIRARCAIQRDYVTT